MWMKWLVGTSLLVCITLAQAETAIKKVNESTGKTAPSSIKKLESELAQKKETEQKALARQRELEREQAALAQKLGGQEPPMQKLDGSAISTVRVLLAPERETTISSMIAARIVALNGSLGRSFKSGDILVAFDCEEALARVEMSKAELAGATDQHEAKVKMQGLDQASDIEVSLAASAANKAKAQLSLNQVQAAQCKIYAPWNGRVAKLNVKPYMTVAAGQPLMELVKEGPLKLRLNVPSKLLARIKNGSQFNVSIDETGQSYQASVSAINSRVDSVSQTVEIEARLTKNYKELLAGMSGEADLTSFQ
jgi:membrane fusion protein (multidrug efflux system)